MFNPTQAEVRRFFCSTHAKQQAGQPMEAIEQIAAQCGFQEYSSFYRSFLENIGTSPAGYRKLGSSRKSPIQE